ncbi:MAG TPA: phosphatase PAP2 family protein [Frankiaceae bacterium]|nr:phosphatase PAP2 family protein [Frankiaceae bacterium]
MTVTAGTGYIVGGSYRSAEKRLSLISVGILALLLSWLAYRAIRRSSRLQVWSRRRLSWLYRLNRNLVAAVAVLVGAVWTVAGLTQDVLEHDGVVRSDPRLLADVVGHRTPTLTVLAKGATFLGSGPAVYGLLTLCAVLVWRRTGRWQPSVLAAGWLTAGLLVRSLLNRAVARPRPPAVLHLVGTQGFAFPSGHTATATIAYGLLPFLVALLVPVGWRRAAAGAVLVAGLVGLSRVYLGVHWPSDVLGGWAFGIGWLALAAVLSVLVRIRRRTPDTAADVGQQHLFRKPSIRPGRVSEARQLAVASVLLARFFRASSRAHAIAGPISVRRTNRLRSAWDG